MQSVFVTCDENMAGTQEMQTFAARLATFHQPHQLSKRRASSQTGSNRSKKNAAHTVEWPHERPSAEQVRITTAHVYLLCPSIVIGTC